MSSAKEALVTQADILIGYAVSAGVTQRILIALDNSVQVLRGAA